MAKRVNTRFLLLLTVLVVLGGMALMAARLVLPRLWRQDPQALVLESRQLEAAGEVDKAILKYQAAVRASMRDANLRVGLGDLYHRHVARDGQNLSKARDAWAGALTVDSGNRDAMRRLLDLAWALSQLSARAETLNQLREAAGRVIAANPADAQARARLHVATVRGAQADVPTRREDLQAAADALRGLAQANPADAETAWWAGRAALHLAGEAAKSPTDAAEARDRLAALEKFVDALRAGQDANALVQYRAAQLYLGLAALDRTVSAPSKSGRPAGEGSASGGAAGEGAAGGRAGRFTQRIAAALAAARANIKPAHPDYADVLLTSAEWIAGDGKGDEAAKLLDEMIAARPDDPKARLGYARALARDPARRAKVMDLLAKPVDFANVHGVDVLRLKELQSTLTYERAKLRLANLDSEPDPAKRRRVLEQVRAEVDELEAAAGAQTIPMLELKGRLAHASGKVPDAISLLQRAVDLRGDEEPDYDVTFQLANAYLAAGQTGQAEKLLRRVVRRFGDNVPARTLLIRTLMADGQAEAARRELVVLKRRNPRAEEIAALAAVVEGGKAREAFVGQLPEKTPAEKVNKAAVLRREGKADEALALARAAFKADAKFMPAVELLLDLHLAAGRRDDAVAVADAALAANPGSESLTRAAEQLARRTPAELDQWRLEQIGREPDAFARELKLADFHIHKAAAPRGAPGVDDAGRKAAAADSDTSGADDDGARKAAADGGTSVADGAARKAAAEAAHAHLDAAEALKRGDVNIASRRFELLLSQRRFEDAAAVMRTLAAADVDAVGGAMLRFRLAAAREDLPAAEAAAREMTRARPEFAEGYQRLGQALQAQSRWREAIDAYAEALERQGRNYAALRGVIESHKALDEPDKAKAALDRALSLFPDDTALGNLALNYKLQHGDPAEVVAERERLVRANPDAPDHALKLAETYLMAGGAQELRQPGQSAEAKQARARAREVLEAGVAKWPGDSRFRVPLARLLHVQGDFPGGERVLKDYAARNGVKGTSAGDLLLAEYYTVAEKPAMAEQSFRDAIAKGDAASGAGTPHVRQRLALLLAKQGRRGEAVAELADVPGPAAARQRVELLLADGKVDEAAEAIRQAVAAHPDSSDLSDLQINLLVDAGRLDDARHLIDERLARNGADDMARYLSSLVKLRKQPPDVAGAVEEMTEVVDRSPRFRGARVLLAEAHWAGGDAATAIAEMGRALELDPLERNVRARLIDWCGVAGKWDAALKLASEAADNPATAADVTWLRSMARAYAAMQKVDEAEQALAKAVGMLPPERVGEVQRDRLGILLGAKQFPKVTKLADEWLAEGRSEWWLHQARGLALQGTGDAPGALRAFDEALAPLDPVEQFAESQLMVATIVETAGPEAALQRVLKWTSLDPRWRVAAADLCLTKQDAAGAVAQLASLLAEAKKLDPKVQAAAYKALGLGYHQLEPPDAAKAVAAYERYLQLHPDDALVLNNVAYILAEESKPADPVRAKKFSARAYGLAKDWRASESRGRVFDTHGWVLVLNEGDDLEKGVRVLEEVVEENPILEAHYHLGEAHLRRKRGGEAEEQLNLALALIAKAKEEKKRVEPGLEARVRQALERAMALKASAQLSKSQVLRDGGSRWCGSDGFRTASAARVRPALVTLQWVVRSSVPSRDR